MQYIRRANIILISNDRAAVAALVRRHGPMVWAVCRRVLRNHHDAEDAFQATFLVLVRKAASIVSREMLANWLYGVAHQTALDAKKKAVRSRGRERQVMDMPEPEVAEQDRSHDLELLLDQELSRLPDKYRAVIVLCDLEGKTRKEAACQLKIPEGTLSTRLMTARTMLAKRLAKHGLAVAVAVGGVVPKGGVGIFTDSVLCSTIKAVSLLAAGQNAAGVALPGAIALAEGVGRAMLVSKCKMVVTALFGLLFCTCWIVGVAQTNGPGKQSEPQMLSVVVGPVKKDLKPVGPMDKKNDQPKPLPLDIIKAWRDAGAEVGWIVWSADDFNGLVFARKSEAGAVPAFRFLSETKGVLAKLPDPGIAFGLSLDRMTDGELKELAGLKSLQSLHLGDTQVTDAGLRELARLKSLQWLHLGRTKVTDVGLKELARLKSLQSLVLWGTQITDVGLKELSGLTNLQSLFLHRTQVTDAGLKELARLKSLQSLHLGRTKVTDVGLKELAGLKSLQSLVLWDTQVTDAGLKELTGLRNLQLLNLWGTQVTGVGLKELAELKNLQSLDIGKTRVMDAGLKELAGLKSLQWLRLRDTPVTDVGIKELAGLKSLQSLDLTLTQVTDEGVAELQKALPTCRIWN